jgi:hypothetical protein
MSREKLKAFNQLQSDFAFALLDTDRVSLAALMAHAISVYVDTALEIEKSKPRNPDDLDMGR